MKKVFILTICLFLFQASLLAVNAAGAEKETSPSVNKVVLTGGQKAGPSLALADKQTVRGKVLLPGNKTAGQGGIDVKVILTGTEKTLKDPLPPEGDDYYYFELEVKEQRVHIPEGGNSADFAIEMDYRFENKDDYDTEERQVNYKLEYLILNDAPEYYNKGCFSGGKTEQEMYSNILPWLIEAKSFDLTLIDAKNISGTISLPKGVTAPDNGIGLKMLAYVSSDDKELKIDTNLGIAESSDIIIPKGSNSASYTIKVPKELSKFVVEYRLNNNDATDYMYRAVYFNGTASISTSHFSVLDLSQGSVKGINFSLIKKGMIKGILKFKDDAKAPKGGYRVSVYAINDKYLDETDEYMDDDIDKYRCDVVIPEGQNKVEYCINIPCTGGFVNKGFYLRYNVNNDVYRSIYINYENPFVVTNGAVTYNIEMGYQRPDHYIKGYIASSIAGIANDSFAIVPSKKWNDLNVLTDKNGYFELLAGDSFQVTISKAGYLQRTIKIPYNAIDFALGNKDYPLTMVAGDVDSNNVINMSDIEEIISGYNKEAANDPDYQVCDLNKDGAINMIDILIAAHNFDKTSRDYSQPDLLKF